jgi:murein DD-endopeptidase MepM/ murein hydrolase activator NlpD
MNKNKMYPPITKPENTWNSGPGMFGAIRGNGIRKHAGCDIYAPVGTPIYAVKRGLVIRDPYIFYLKTFAIEIDHLDFILRYCELGAPAPGIKQGAVVGVGELIGHVGKLEYEENTNSMLHLEMYSDTEKGPLTDYKNPPYLRRSDLSNPTKLLNCIYG